MRNAMPQGDQAEESIVLFSGGYRRPPAESYVESGPQFEGSAAKSHVATVADTPETGCPKPVCIRVVDDLPLFSVAKRQHRSFRSRATALLAPSIPGHNPPGGP